MLDDCYFSVFRIVDRIRLILREDECESASFKTVMSSPQKLDTPELVHETLKLQEPLAA